MLLLKLAWRWPGHYTQCILFSCSKLRNWKLDWISRFGYVDPIFKVNCVDMSMSLSHRQWQKDKNKCVCVFVCLKAVRLSDHRGRLYFSGLSSEIQPLPSERAESELQSSGRLRSEAAVSWTRGSTLETEHSRVWTDNKSSHTVPLSHWQAEDC